MIIVILVVNRLAPIYVKYDFCYVPGIGNTKLELSEILALKKHVFDGRQV